MDKRGRTTFDPEMGTEYIGAFDPTDLSPATQQAALSFIHLTLCCFAQEGSFGTVIQYAATDKTPPTPVLLFGFRDPPPQERVFESWVSFGGAPEVPVLVSDEVLNTLVVAPTTWLQNVHHYDKLMIRGTSIGSVNDLVGARSFGCYLNTSSGRLLGLTTGHSVPHEVGTEICSPSMVEVTARFQTILPYTTYRRGNVKPRIKRQEEANELILKYRSLFTNADEAVNVPGLPQKVALYGPRLGELIASAIHYTDVLDRHNQGLRSQGRKELTIGPNTGGGVHARLSRIDWAVFTIDEGRRGDNYFEEEQEAVGSPVLVGPGDRVMKSGRTTGYTHGVINGTVVQAWIDGRVSVEIGVLGSRAAFADHGDSGSLCITEDANQALHAAALVIGVNRRFHLAIITPLWTVLKDIEAKLGERVNFYQSGIEKATT